MITLLTRPAVTAVNPEYACDLCKGWHSDACPAAHRLHQMVRHLVADGDLRAAAAGRRARRTLAEMAPGTPGRGVVSASTPPPLEGPTTNDDDLDRALGGPWDDEGDES
ncbi:hypothetical protein QR77_41465 [Streptomyces sp. 150FB]|uniref:hypothetical protein n=1 Tax=Streptomyces sp. 150FB TaxID=1576605 RepID=UPI00058950B6|nr:hypothetical protein [Streptomyces sp. 150FB]KIF72753.1 hypothetical protein QR77_41465 [Streptomyces sp. 150FB]